MSNRVAIVTGGAQGIGRAVALRLASDGLDVAIADVEDKKAGLDEVAAAIQKLGRKAFSLVCDISQEENVKLLVQKTVEELGSVDVMVANAGIAQKQFTPLAEVNLSDWERVFDINLKGVMYSYKYAAEQMIKQGRGGRIIGASSICGKKGFFGMGAYCMTKAAVRSLTQTLSMELADHKITVNAYAPGAIETPMMQRPELDAKLGRSCAAAMIALRIPDAPLGQPEDVAQTVSFLASPESQFVTGQTISVNGGIFFD